MFTKIKEIWPIIVTIAGAIGGLAYFIIQILTMKKQKLEIDKLRRERDSGGGMIYKPTNDEILKYGVGRRLFPSAAAFLGFCVVSTYLYTNYSSVSSLNFNELSTENKNIITSIPNNALPEIKAPMMNTRISVTKIKDTVFVTSLVKDTSKENELIANIAKLKSENSELKKFDSRKNNLEQSMTEKFEKEKQIKKYDAKLKAGKPKLTDEK